MRFFTFLLFICFHLSLLSAKERLFSEKHPSMKKPTVSSREKELIDHIEKSLDFSERHISTLSEEILSLGGTMSSPRTRVFLHHLCSLPQARYLEIGVHKGASTVSALYNNPIEYAYSIDNFSEFGDVFEEFQQNCKRYLSKAPLTFIQGDSFCIDPTTLPKFNIYFYDGNHSVEAQEKAFTHFNSCLDDLFIAIVDDWMWEQVREGTFSAFEKLSYEILFEKEVALRFKDDKPWRYLYVCLVRKSA